MSVMIADHQLKLQEGILLLTKCCRQKIVTRKEVAIHLLCRCLGPMISILSKSIYRDRAINLSENKVSKVSLFIEHQNKKSQLRIIIIKSFIYII